MLLAEAGIAARGDGERGFDHGVFIPFKLIYPDADIPIVQLSLKAGLAAGEHIAVGRALEDAARRRCADRRQRHELSQYARLRFRRLYAGIGGIRRRLDRSRLSARSGVAQ